jgi:hypothetical protein
LPRKFSVLRLGPACPLVENLTRFSAIVKPGAPADFAAFIAAELPKWADLVALSGATSE